jgi:hypothetical protein
MMNLSSAFMTAPVEAIDAIFSATGMSSIYALSANYPLGYRSQPASSNIALAADARTGLSSDVMRTNIRAPLPC